MVEKNSRSFDINRQRPNQQFQGIQRHRKSQIDSSVDFNQQLAILLKSMKKKDTFRSQTQFTEKQGENNHSYIPKSSMTNQKLQQQQASTKRYKMQKKAYTTIIQKKQFYTQKKPKKIKNSLPFIKPKGIKFYSQKRCENLNGKEDKIIFNYLNAQVRQIKFKKSSKYNRHSHNHHKNEHKHHFNSFCNELENFQSIQSNQKEKDNIQITSSKIHQNNRYNNCHPNQSTLDTKFKKSQKNNLEDSRLQTIDYNVESKSVQKLKPIQQKQKQWKQISIFNLQTYFVKIKNNTNLNSGETTSHLKTLNFPSLPKQGHLVKFIKNYSPINKSINIQHLIKNKRFDIQSSGIQLYFGQFEEGIRHGKGILIKQKYIYEGQWNQNHKKNGIERSQAGTYNGDFSDECRSGKGQFHWKNGEYYSGQWKSGKKHGSGLWKSPKGDSYIGQWKNGIVEGYGLHRTANSNSLIHNQDQKYQGQFKAFLKHGQGRQTLPDGDSYFGYYQNGKPHGKGRYQWANGAQYQGQFKQGYRHGKGILKHNMIKYQGDFEMEKADGVCIMNLGNGDCYHGRVKNGKRNGWGVYNNKKQKKIYEGDWIDGSFQFQ